MAKIPELVIEDAPGGVSEADMNNPRAFIMRRGKVLRAPGRDVAEFEAPFSPIVQVPQDIREAGLAGDRIRAERQYQDEVDSADRVRRAQEQEQYFSQGLRPPPFLSEFSPPSAEAIRLQRPATPRYLKSGNDWYSVPPGGVPSLVVDAPDKLAPPSRFFDADYVSQNPAPEGYEFIPYGQGGNFSLEKKPRKGIEAMVQEFLGEAPKSQGPKHPKRSEAADFVNRFGRDRAVEELKKAGYDVSRYAD